MATLDQEVCQDPQGLMDSLVVLAGKAKLDEQAMQAHLDAADFWVARDQKANLAPMAGPETRVLVAHPASRELQADQVLMVNRETKVHQGLMVHRASQAVRAQSVRLASLAGQETRVLMALQALRV